MVFNVWGIISLRHKVRWYAKGTGTVPPLFSTFLHAFRRRRWLVTLWWLLFSWNLRWTCVTYWASCAVHLTIILIGTMLDLCQVQKKTYLCKSLWVERYPSKIYGPSHNSNITIWSQCTFFSKMQQLCTATINPRQFAGHVTMANHNNDDAEIYSAYFCRLYFSTNTHAKNVWGFLAN